MPDVPPSTRKLTLLVVAGAYGAATVSTRILIVQVLPAALAVVALFLA